MLLPTALRKLWIYQMLPFIVSRDISPIMNNVPDQDFFWSVIMNFIPDWESKIVHPSGLQTNSSQN